MSMKERKSARSQFVTRTGVIAATVGSAVGMGNIWRFPYEAGMHGGGAFLLIYIVCVFIIGVPVMVAEFAIGRETHSNALGAFRKLRPGTPFRIVAYMGIVSSMMILSFYSVVAGWILEYFFQSVTALADSGISEAGDHFVSLTSDPWRPVMWTLIFLGINFLVLLQGIEKGIEKVANIFTPCLFVILVIFAINSLTMPGAGEGMRFLFAPDFSKLTPSVVIGAMGQAFFSLSLGLACLLTYASYFSDDTPLMRSATITASLDTMVAILAGVMIFPAVFTYGVEPQAGPKLVFEILPAVFAQMPGGSLWSIAFFLLLFVASITSTISMSEISISYLIEEHRMGRTKATVLSTAIVVVFAVLCALSFGPLADFKIFGLTVFDLFDFTSSNILLPMGGILISLFAGWVLDRTFLQRQLSVGGHLPHWVISILRLCIRFIAPAAIAVIFISGLI